MSKLDSSLKEWAAQGLLTPDQVQRIRQYEDRKPESSWILSGLLILGAVIVGIGVISVIAANWAKIPDAAKLAIDFALLAALGFASLFAWDKKKSTVFDVLLLGFLLMVLASIGLIAQIYNTGGQPYQALMLWCVISFAAMYTTRHILVPFLWSAAFLAAFMGTVSENQWVHFIFEKNSAALAMAIPLLYSTAALASRRWTRDRGATRAFQVWIFLSGIAAILVAELDRKMTGIGVGGNYAYLPGYFFAALTSIAILLAPDFRRTQKTALLAALGMFVLLFLLPQLDLKYSLPYAVATIGVLLGLAIYLASVHERRGFQLLLILLGMRFLILYFEAIGGLAYTGFGLIVSGALVIGMAVVWNKYRKALADWAEEWAR